MLSHSSRSVLIASWTALVTVIAGTSIAMGANLSTTAFMLALGGVCGIVLLPLLRSAPPPTAAEILYAVAKAVRR